MTPGGDTPPPLDVSAVARIPAVYLVGSVDEAMYLRFRDQIENLAEPSEVAIHLSTLGGDPEIARAIAADVALFSPGRKVVFVGKAAVYSAGVTLMSAFPREARYLTKGTRLLVHERKLDKDVALRGPLSACVPVLEAALSEVRAGQAIQVEGFEDLVRGSRVGVDEVLRNAASNWYIDAQEALELGLVAAVL